MVSVSRRKFVQTLGIGFGAAALGPLLQKNQSLAMPFQDSLQVAAAGEMSFKPIRAALPFPTDGIDLASEAEFYSTFTVIDDVVLPEGFEYTVITSWGDDLGNGDRVGFNHDYTSFLPMNEAGDEGLLSINHEYIDPMAWMSAYGKVIQDAPVISRVQNVILNEAEETFTDDEIKFVCGEALREMGVSVQMIKKSSGKWQPTASPYGRAISGISGLGINKVGATEYQGVQGRTDYLVASGPALQVFEQGWDGLGNRIIGTIGNCSGGDTPWGTVMTAEENFQSWVQEPVLPNGQSPLPNGDFDISDASSKLAALALTDVIKFDAEDGVRGAGSAFMLAGNKYGWMVEIDPTMPDAHPVKHTALGRFRHENITFRAEEGKPLVAYMGDDRRGGHTWKYVSKGIYRAAAGKANSQLLTEGTLYAAKLDPMTKDSQGGKGVWIPLTMDTPINPIPLAYLTPDKDRKTGAAKYNFQLPARQALGHKNDGGSFKPQTQAEIMNFMARYKTLGDLYESQGAIMIDAFLAANAVGATPTARPEDLEVHPFDKSVYIAYTDGRIGGDGSPDARTFLTRTKDANDIGKAGPQPFGAIFRLLEEGNEPTAMSFSYEVFQSSGEVGSGGPGYANVDNLVFDPNGNLWLVTDQSTSGHNRAIKDRKKDPINGAFGSNSLIFVPTSGPDAGKPYLFSYGPVECEMTGPTFTRDGQTLFIAVQHPGEVNGIRKQKKQEVREMELLARDGKSTFKQTRVVPMGSNWPTGSDGDPPKPSVIAIQKKQGGIA
ncbi:MAG: DUF839 domain-containing protein [Cyanobacteriota bacterium]|nr:DUF839 domain-containing protein [Cyanobacteriota bacterium]